MELQKPKVTRRKKQTTSGTDYIQPLVKTEGEIHPLIQLASSGETIELVAVGVAPIVKGSSRAWVSYKITIEGDKVTKLEVSETMNQLEASMTAKIDFQNMIEDVFV